MSKLIKRFKRRIKRAFEFVKNLFRFKRRPNVEPEAVENNGLKQRVAAHCTETKERVAKRSKTLKTKVVGFFKKIGKWFKVRANRVKSFVKKTTARFACVFAAFSGVFYGVTVLLANAIMALALCSVPAGIPTMCAVLVTFLANVGIAYMFKVLMARASAVLEKRMTDLWNEIDCAELDTALKDEKFANMYDEWVNFQETADEAQYSKAPRLYKFVNGINYRVYTSGAGIAAVTATGIIGGLSGVSVDAIGGLMGLSLGAVGLVGFGLYAVTTDIANYRCQKAALNRLYALKKQLPKAYERVINAEKEKTAQREKDLQHAIDTGDFTMYNLKYGCKCGPTKNKKK